MKGYAGLTGRAKPTPAEVDRLRSHSRFSEAARHVASSMVEIYDGNRVLNALLNNTARTQMAYTCLYLHWSRRPGDAYSGLTMSRFKAICVAQKFCSAGRAEAMMALMRTFGYVKVVSDPYDRRVRLIVPTEKFLLPQIRRWRRQFEAMRLIMPEGELGLAALERDDFPPAFVKQVCETYYAGLRFYDYVPGFNAYMDRNGGMLIFLSLFTRCSAATMKLTISISRMARQFGVSRAHVRQLLRDADSNGLIHREGKNGCEISILPKFIESIERVIAAIFLLFAECLSNALAEIGPDSLAES